MTLGGLFGGNIQPKGYQIDESVLILDATDTKAVRTRAVEVEGISLSK